MREIKFRAWIINDTFSDKSYMDYNPTMAIYGEASEFSINDFEATGAGNKSILMQYTGLKDKNGKEIYEGDIVRNLHFNSTAQVVWKECEPAKHSDKYEDLEGFISNLGEFEFVGIGGRTKAFYINEFEVIGNIYENPELINNK